MPLTCTWQGVFSTIDPVSGRSTLTDLAIDTHRHRVFWSDSLNHAIRSVDLDGADWTTHASGTFADNPTAIYLDTNNGQLIWAESTQDLIYQHDLDTGATDVLLDVTAAFGEGSYGGYLGLTVKDNSILFLNASTDQLLSFDIDTSDASVMLDIKDFYLDLYGTTHNAIVQDMVIEDDTIYWTESQTGIRGIYGFDMASSHAFRFSDVQGIEPNLIPLDLATITSVPEPKTFVALGSIAGVLFAYRRRRQQFAGSPLTSDC